MKIATLIVRFLLAALLLFASITFFLKLDMESDEVLSKNFQTFMAGLSACAYLLPLAKIVEFVVAISFLTNKYVPLFCLVLLPVSLNIVLIHGFMSPDDLPVGLFLFFE